LRKEKGRGKDVYGMGRRKGIGIIAIGQQACTLEHVAGAYPSHPVLKLETGKKVGDGQEDPNKYHEDNPPLPLPPENPKDQSRQNVDKIIKVGHEWHKPVEKGILSLPIDEMKKENVRRSQK
jgi:hypothetical protein